MPYCARFKSGFTADCEHTTDDGITIIKDPSDTLTRITGTVDLLSESNYLVTQEMEDYWVTQESLRIKANVHAAVVSLNTRLSKLYASDAKALLDKEQALKQFQLKISKQTEPNQLELFTTPEVTAIAIPAAEILNNGTTTPTATTA